MDAICKFDRESVLSQLKTPIELAHRRLAERVLADSNIFILVDTGALRLSGHITSDYSVVWNTDYAERVYYAEENGLRVHTEKNPNAQSHWFEPAYALKFAEWVELVQSIIAPRK